MLAENTPILVAVGQSLLPTEKVGEQLPSIMDLAVAAVQRAIADSGVAELAKHIDRVAVVRSFIDSIPGAKPPFGGPDNVPGAVAKRIGASPKSLVYTTEGGQTPQRQVNESYQLIASGDCEVALICGAEATGVMKHAMRNGLALDWREDVGGQAEDRGCHMLWTDEEARHQITMPTQVYGLMENAWRAQCGRSLEEHRKLAGQLFAAFSKVAASNPYAQFPKALSAEFISTISDDNYWVASPYSKWMVAQDAVNQGCAIIMTSVAKARALGIDPAKWVYLHAYEDCDDHFVTQRPELHRSEAMHRCLKSGMSKLDLDADALFAMDLYSCFPIAVLTASQSLGIDENDPRPRTLTGGLPFFGGAGNNYSAHAIAEMVLRAREQDGFGLVYANGGFLSKHSMGIYSRQVASIIEHSDQCQHEFDALATVVIDETPKAKQGVVEAYTLVYQRGKPSFGIIVGRDTSGCRFIANTSPQDDGAMQILEEGEVIGRSVATARQGELNIATF